MKEARSSKVKSKVLMLWRWILGMPGSLVRRAQLIQLKIKKLEFLAWACIGKEHVTRSKAGLELRTLASVLTS